MDKVKRHETQDNLDERAASRTNADAAQKSPLVIKNRIPNLPRLVTGYMSKASIARALDTTEPIQAVSTIITFRTLLRALTI